MCNDCSLEFDHPPYSESTGSELSDAVSTVSISHFLAFMKHIEGKKIVETFEKFLGSEDISNAPKIQITPLILKCSKMHKFRHRNCCKIPTKNIKKFGNFYNSSFSATFSGFLPNSQSKPPFSVNSRNYAKIQNEQSFKNQS